MIDLLTAAKYVTAIGVIGGAAIGADIRYAPASTVSELKSELRVDRIFDLVNQAASSGSPGWLCQALDREFVTLCTDLPSHYLCGTEARRELKAKAGC
jgi:hypothetical protein